jgi:hypothetical protein
MEPSNVSSAPPHTVRLALRLGWLLVIMILVTKLWPYWSSAAAMFPSDTGWVARCVALIFASFLLLFTPLLIGQLVTVSCLLLLARRQGWARWVFFVGVVVSTMLTIAAIVGKLRVSSVALLYIQLLLLIIQIVFVALLFGRDSNDWFRKKRS